MTLFTWCAQRAGGLSMLFLVALCYWVISREASVERWHSNEQPGDSRSLSSTTSTTGAGIWTHIFAYYCFAIHVLVCIFPLRACWTVWCLTRSLKRSAQSQSLLDLKKLSSSRRSSYASVSSSETLISTYNDEESSTTTEAGDFEPELCTDSVAAASDSVTHAIVIPNYKEELHTLKETLEVLASHSQARNTYDVYLGMEQRETNADTKALELIQEFAKQFRSINYTLHPSDIPGEAAGKGSNIGWAARELSSRYSIKTRKDVIITGIDADSHLSSDYFSILTNMHLAYPETALTTLYSAPVVFDRNAHLVPALVRVADILWCAAGMSGLYPGSSIAPPTSVYSLPLDLVDRVGGWDCNSEAIGEDLHMYIKCFFALNGNLTSRVIYSPVSQSNVTGTGTAWSNIVARYKQALRHMWGALDTGFALRKLVEMWQDRKYTSRAYQPLHCKSMQTTEMYVPDSQLDAEAGQTQDNGIFSDINQGLVKEPHWEYVYYMMHRLFEAHFLPVHMAVLVIASTLYVKLTQDLEDTHGLLWIFGWCNVIRIFGFFQISVYMFLYESYHRVSVATRERQMVMAGLAENMDFSRRSLGRNWYDYLVVPVVAPLYGTIPSAQALLCQLWGKDLVYTVSKKAARRPVPLVKVDEMA